MIKIFTLLGEID